MNWQETLIKALIWVGVPFFLLLIAAVVVWYGFLRKMIRKANADFAKNSDEQSSLFRNFRKNKAKEVSPNQKLPTFKDVGGMPEVIEDLGEIVKFLKEPKEFDEIGARAPKGILLHGEPGTGKTLLARAIAGETGVKFFYISGSDFMEMLVGVGSSRVHDLYEEARSKAPSIIFIDEVDAVGGKRAGMAIMGDGEKNQTLNKLLYEMDGFEGNSGVLTLAATNRYDTLDPALLRRGRFDRQILISMPDIRGRKEILGIHLKKVRHVPEFDIEGVASETFGYSGADLESVINEAAILAVCKNKKRIDMKDFKEADARVRLGLARKGRVITEKKKRMIAYHEAGHTIVFIKSGAPGNVSRVTIMGYGEAGGVTQWIPQEEGRSLFREQFRNLIAAGLGGRAAECIVYEDFTSGAVSDIQRTTAISQAMVTEFGMSDEIGPIRYSRGNMSIPGLPGGMGMGEGSVCSEATQQKIDKEVKKIIDDEFEKAKRILTENRAALDELVELLMVIETVSGEEAVAILKKHSPQTEKK